MKMKKAASLLLCAAMTMGLVACGEAEPEATSGNTADKASSVESKSQEAAAEEEHSPVTLRFMWWGGDERHEATLAVIEQFEELYPWITIEGEYSSSDGYQEKLTTQLSSGTEADIIQMGVGWMPGYVNSGADYFVDFLDYTDIFPLTNFEEGFLKTNGYFDGHQYGIPTGLAGTALIYNKELAEAVGLDFSKELTWDDLIEYGKKVQEYDSSKYLMTIDETMLTTAVLRPYLLQLTGNTFFLDDTCEMGFTEEELVQTLEYVKALYDNNVVAPIASVVPYSENLQTDPNWIAGNYVTMFCYTSTAEPAVAACENAEFGAAYLPKMAGSKDDGFYCNCPQYMVVSKKSEHVEEAMMFLDYFYNNEKAAETLKTTRSVPPTTVGQTVCENLGLLNGIAKETVDICQKYSGTYEMGLSTEEEPMAIMKDMLSAVAYGQKTPEEAAADAIVLYQNYLNSKK